jgi:hypothetical protein
MVWDDRKNQGLKARPIVFAFPQETMEDPIPPQSDLELPQRLSAKATRKDGPPLTEAEIEAAEAEAEAWARRVNSC